MNGQSDSHPQISVVTPCYNSEKYVREAIESVREQDYPNVEHVVIDGGSTDETARILDEYSHLDVVSEPDDGIYDALNKGLARASGDYVAWLNADDKFAPHAFTNLARAASRTTGPDLVAGKCEVFETVDGDERVRRTQPFTPASKFERGEITHSGAYLNGCLFDAEFLDRVGAFDDSLAYSADVEYLIRVAAEQPTVAETAEVVYRFRHHPDSLTYNDRDTFESVRGVSLREGREFTREYLRDTNLPDPLLAYCRREFRERSGALVVENLNRMRVGRVLSITIDTLRSDPGWSVWMVSKALEKIGLSINKR